MTSPSTTSETLLSVHDVAKVYGIGRSTVYDWSEREIAQELRVLRKQTKAKADDAVFVSPPTLKDFKADLAVAGVPFEVARDKGRLDFHALRRTLIKLAKRAGLSLDQASLLLGHRDVRTTKKFYDEDVINPDLGDSVERLPTLGKVRLA